MIGFSDVEFELAHSVLHEPRFNVNVSEAL